MDIVPYKSAKTIILFYDLAKSILVFLWLNVKNYALFAAAIYATSTHFFPTPYLFVTKVTAILYKFASLHYLFKLLFLNTCNIFTHLSQVNIWAASWQNQ